MNWFYKIRDVLKFRLFIQSEIDPCLFIKNNIICLIYVDNTIFFSKYQKHIDKMVTSLKNYFDLTDEGDVYAYLGVKIENSHDGSITMTQLTLIESIIQYVVLENTSKKNDTLSLQQPLLKHKS